MRGAAIALAAGASAAQITFRSDLVPPTSGYASIPLSLQQFDPSPGTLSTVYVQLLTSYNAEASTDYDLSRIHTLFVASYGIRVELSDASGVVAASVHADEENNVRSWGFNCISGGGSTSTGTISVKGANTLNTTDQS